MEIAAIFFTFSADPRRARILHDKKTHTQQCHRNRNKVIPNACPNKFDFVKQFGCRAKCFEMFNLFLWTTSLKSHCRAAVLASIPVASLVFLLKFSIEMLHNLNSKQNPKFSELNQADKATIRDGKSKMPQHRNLSLRCFLNF